MSDVIVTYKPTPFDSGDKRFYLPGLVVKWTCACGKKCTHDFAEDYLSHPTFNAVETETLSCFDCEAGVSIKLKLSLVVELVP